MQIQNTELPGLAIVQPMVFSDSRGYFFESFNSGKFTEQGLKFDFVQDNESLSVRGVIRGLHYQAEPYAQTKLVRVIEGEIYDVALDLRKGSPTFGKWYGLILDSISKRQFLIPRGFAHGFSVLSEKAVVMYKCDNFYSREHERGINARDPFLKIDWKIPPGNEIFSEKDIAFPEFRDIKTDFIYRG